MEKYLIFQRSENKEGENPTVCYKAQNKSNKKNSPCFNKQTDLMNWIQQNRIGGIQIA